MSTVGLLIDPEFGTGIGGAPGAAVRCHVSSRQKRIFDKDELKGVHTHVELFLPFSMHGFTGTYRSSSQLSLALTIVEWPPHIAAAHLGLIPQDVNHLSLTPDTWGHVNYTRAELIHANFEPIEPHVSADREDHYRRIFANLHA